jgi:hypothetical protein
MEVHPAKPRLTWERLSDGITQMMVATSLSGFVGAQEMLATELPPIYRVRGVRQSVFITESRWCSPGAAVSATLLVPAIKNTYPYPYPDEVGGSSEGRNVVYEGLLSNVRRFGM